MERRNGDLSETKRGLLALLPYQEDTLRLIEANRDRLPIDPRLASEDNQSQSADNRRTIEFD